MQIQAEQENDKIVLQSEERNHTTLNLVKKYLWQADAEAGYSKGHPYIGASKLVFAADDPEAAVEEAVEQAQDNLDEFKDAMSE